jgi:hypothetical protein
MPIYSIVHHITAGESASINSLKHLILYLRSIIAAGKIKVNNLHKTFLDFLL